MSEYVYDTIYSEDGNTRANIIVDPYPSQPDGCYFGTVYGGERGYFGLLGYDHCEGATDVSLDSLWSEFGDWEAIEEVVRGRRDKCYHCDGELYATVSGGWVSVKTGGSRCEESGDGDHEPEFDYRDLDVVGFDVRHTGHGTELVNIATLADLKHWGWESVEAFREAVNAKADVPADVDPSHGNLDEWVDWAEGNVYFVALEERVRATTVLHSVDGKHLRTTEEDEWIENDDYTCHGFYGDESAEEYAKECLADHARGDA